MSARHLIPFLVLLAAAHTAHADAVGDFKTGTAVMLETATVNLGDGPRSSSGSGVITKRGGSFDFALQASDLGVNLPITIDLHGRVMGNGWIEFTVDNTYSPRVDLGAGQWLSRVTGRIYLRAFPLPGREKSEVGNVRLHIARASHLVAHGGWGQLTIAIDELTLQGGVPQPPLAGLADASRTVICSNKMPTYHMFVVSLAELATASGAAVELKTPRGAGVHVPSAVVVRGGRRSATVTARIDPSFVGTVRLTAAAGGVARSLDVVVRPPIDCALR